MLRGPRDSETAHFEVVKAVFESQLCVFGSRVVLLLLVVVV
jgi:hypothetical protein